MNADGDGVFSVALGGEDCDNGDSGVHPGADEVCDGRDNDCDDTNATTFPGAVQGLLDDDCDGVSGSGSLALAD